MNVLRQVWADIRKGENIDLYVSVVVAGGLAILTLLGAPTQTMVSSITLAVLALLAATNLGNRHRLEDMKHQLSKNGRTVFAKEFPPELKSELEAASELWLIGVSLSRTVKTNYDLIENKLQQGHIIKVMVVYPDGPGIDIAVSRNYTRRDITTKRNEILATLQSLCDLRNNTGGALEIRTITNPLAYGAIAINPNSASGALYLEHYCFRMTTESLPKYALKSSDGQWYDFFKQEISALWNAGIDWSC